MTAPTLYSRFQLLDSPLIAPGKCVVCGGVQGPVVDLQLDIIGYGTVYFCVSCLQEAAGVLDMVPQSEVISREAELGQSLQQYTDEKGLTVVTNEWYDTVTDSIGRLSNLALGGVLLGVDETSNDGRTSDDPDYATTRGLPKDGPKKPQQNDRPAGNKRSTSVPASNGDGSEPVFNL